MTRLLIAAPMASLSFVALLLLAAFAIRTGLVSDDAVNLWAGAIAAGDGEVSVGRIVAAYPTIPFMMTTVLEVLMPTGTPTPALLAAGILGLVCGVWFLHFRDAGLSLLVAIAAAILTAFHPAMIRATVAGPAEIFFALFLFMLAKGLYDLRARSTASEVMTVGLALLGLSFSHPMGAAITVAAVPFLLLAVRPALVAHSAPSVLVALIFPTVFCFGAFSYMSWVFPGSGWSFLNAPAASLSSWSAGMARIVTEAPITLLVAAAGLATILALALGAPLVTTALIWISQRRPLLLPALILIAATVVAAMLAVATGLFGDPAVLVVAAPILAAVVLMRVPDLRERGATAIALLVLGWLGGTGGLVVVDPRLGWHAIEALNGAGGDRDRIDALNLGSATIGHEGVLVDTYNAPAVVLGRGESRGLLGPNVEAFTLALMFPRMDARLIAVPDPQGPVGAQDRLNKVYPQLYRRGAPGYRLVYQNATWRMFQKVGDQSH